jgi:hypothetical protein
MIHVVKDRIFDPVPRYGTTTAKARWAWCTAMLKTLHRFRDFARKRWPASVGLIAAAQTVVASGDPWPPALRAAQNSGLACSSDRRAADPSRQSADGCAPLVSARDRGICVYRKPTCPPIAGERDHNLRFASSRAPRIPDVRHAEHRHEQFDLYQPLQPRRRTRNRAACVAWPRNCVTGVMSRSSTRKSSTPANYGDTRSTRAWRSAKVRSPFSQRRH